MARERELGQEPGVLKITAIDDISTLPGFLIKKIDMYHHDS